MANETLTANKTYVKKTGRKGNSEKMDQAATIQLVEQAKNGNKLAKEVLIKSNMNLIVSTVIKCNYGADKVKADAIQEGIMGLLRAIETYDVERGAKFSSYAVYWIKAEVLRNMRKQVDGKMILASHIYEENSKISSFRRKFVSNNGREPTIEEISKGTKLDEKKINAALNAKEKEHVSSIELPTALDAEQTLGDTIAAEEEDILDRINEEKQNEVLYRVIDLLPPKTADILKMLYGMYPYEREYRPCEVAAKYGTTKEKIAQIENSALEKLNKERGAELRAYKDGQNGITYKSYMTELKKALNDLDISDKEKLAVSLYEGNVDGYKYSVSKIAKKMNTTNGQVYEWLTDVSSLLEQDNPSLAMSILTKHTGGDAPAKTTKITSLEDEDLTDEEHMKFRKELTRIVNKLEISKNAKIIFCLYEGLTDNKRYPVSEISVRANMTTNEVYDVLTEVIDAIEAISPELADKIS